jgi:hypothetical protein
MIISMKTINPNCWALYDEWGAPVPITAPPVAIINNLYLYNSIELAIFYYRLSGVVFFVI